MPFRRMLAAPFRGFAALSLSLVAACSGGGSAPNGSLQPIPAPLPAPPPPAAPVPVQFPPASSPQTYSTHNVGIGASVTVVAAADQTLRITGVPAVTSSGPPDRIGLTITYQGPDSYAVDVNGFGGYAFSPANRVAAGSAPLAVFRIPGQSGSAANFDIAVPLPVELTYTSYGSYTELSNTDRPVADAFSSFFVAGSRTPVGQMPTSGSASYSGIADGLWIDGSTVYRLNGSPTSLSADFATGQVTSRLELQGHSDAFGQFWTTPTVPLATLTGTGSIGSGRSTFSGSYTPASGLSGTFSGGFFGPAAREFGLAFSLNGRPGQTVVGVAVGTQR